MKDLLLLHGAIGASGQLEELKILLQKNFRVHLLDFEGHGKKPFSHNPFRIEHFAENVLDFLDENKIERTDIFGYSMGGYAALYLASFHPERVGKILNLATKFNWTPETALKESKMLNPQKIKEKIPKFAETLAKRHLHGWTKNLEATAEMMLRLGNQPLLNNRQLKKISSECLICVGDQDTMVSVEETKQAASIIPNASFLLLENTEHPIEKVDLLKIKNLINRFFLNI